LPKKAYIISGRMETVIYGKHEYKWRSGRGRRNSFRLNFNLSKKMLSKIFLSGTTQFLANNAYFKNKL